jgi:adenylate kinase family enzyme
MFSFIFLLGRPGCGKSAVYQLLADRIRREKLADEVMRIDDFPILKEIVEQDKDFEKHVRAEGGFQITDRSIYDDVLKEVNRRIKAFPRPGRLVFVEFSRSGYAQAFRNFDREVLDRSLLVYIYCPYEVCLERNIRRFKEGARNLDEHIVPRDLMEKYYRYDDYEELFLKSEDELKKRAPAPIVVIRNDVEGLERLKREAEKIVSALKLGVPNNFNKS